MTSPAESFDLGAPDMPGYLDLVNSRILEIAPGYIEGVGRLFAAKGKQLRPRLVIAIASHYGRPVDEAVINAASAVELVHLASLIHDDIMDGGTLRHGVPTINAKEGADQALLAGDFLIAQACLLASRVDSQATALIAQAVADLCEGQAVELRFQFDIGRTKQDYLAAVHGKTVALFTAATLLGCHIAEVNDDDTRALNSFIENFGLAFQLSDDVADFTLPTDVTGKSVRRDLSEGNYTLPVIYTLAGPQGQQLRELLQKGAPDVEVIDLLERDGSIKHTVQEAADYKTRALTGLNQLQNRPLATGLQAFASKL